MFVCHLIDNIFSKNISQLTGASATLFMILPTTSEFESPLTDFESNLSFKHFFPTFLDQYQRSLTCPLEGLKEADMTLN